MKSPQRTPHGGYGLRRGQTRLSGLHSAQQGARGEEEVTLVTVTRSAQNPGAPWRTLSGETVLRGRPQGRLVKANGALRKLQVLTNTHASTVAPESVRCSRPI